MRNSVSRGYVKVGSHLMQSPTLKVCRSVGWINWLDDSVTHLTTPSWIKVIYASYLLLFFTLKFSPTWTSEPGWFKHESRVDEFRGFDVVLRMRGHQRHLFCGLGTHQNVFPTKMDRMSSPRLFQSCECTGQKYAVFVKGVCPSVRRFSYVWREIDRNNDV